MSSSDFFPAVTSIHLSTKKGSSELKLYKEITNSLHVSCTIGGLTQRTIPNIHEEIDYTAIYFTLYHQFGGKETTIVRRYMIEYDPKQEDIKFDDDHIEFEIPIDDDFSNLDFVTNYYFLQISFTNKQPGVMGLSQSIYNNEIFKSKIPFTVSEKVI
ncbi:hypothetical protein OF864_22490 [Bacillus cereus]|uniref:hypothetical protein n=1 Tax=Bacillus TaxID=1386 RepID=UPI0024BA4F5D|nr:hypothetical protein [Bacillus cereus]WHS74561.1 hypothetical protein OF864_22490 [Bacillus cereus]